MLVLSRKRGEAVRIDASVAIAVLEIRKGQVKLGISGTREVPIHREEVYQKINDPSGKRYHAATP